MLGKGGGDVLGTGPEIGRKELVGVSDSIEASLDEILRSTGHTGGSGEAIIDTSELQDLLGDGGGDEAGTSGGGGQLEADGATLAGRLDGNGMHVTDLVTPITSSDGDEGKFSGNKGTLNSNLNFLGNFNTKTNVTVMISDGNNSLEASSLTSLGLLLNGNNFHNLIGELNFGVLLL